MKKLTLTSTIFIAMAATSVFAHHPAESMLSTETYEMITENLEAVDSPHLTMDLYNMGSAAGMEAGSSGMEQAERSLSGWQSSQVQAGEVPPIQPDPPIDTVDLLENVDNALAE